MIICQTDSLTCHLQKELTTFNIPYYSQKFGQELNLAVWLIDQSTAKLKSGSIKSLIQDCTRAMVLRILKQIGGCDLWASNCFCTRANSVRHVAVSIRCNGRASSWEKQYTSSRYLPGYMSVAVLKYHCRVPTFIIAQNLLHADILRLRSQQDFGGSVRLKDLQSLYVGSNR